jgi:hypothetical protein
MSARVAIVFVLCCFLALSACTSVAPQSSPTVPQPTNPPQDAAPAQPSGQSGNLSTPDLIDQSLTAGQISEGQRILYLAYAVYEPASLPAQFRSTVPWRGTSTVQEIKKTVSSMDAFCSFDSEIQSELRRLVPQSADCPN